MSENVNKAFSFTALSDYSKCSLRFKYKYIDKFETKHEFTETIPGNIIHTLVDMFWKSRTVDSDEYDFNIIDDNFHEIAEKYIKSKACDLKKASFGRDLDTAKENIYKMVKTLVQQIKDNNLHKREVISEFRWHWKNPIQISENYFLHGGFDYLGFDDISRSSGILLDFKTSSSEYYIDYNQLYLYAIAAENSFGCKVHSVGFVLPKIDKFIIKKFDEGRKQSSIIWAEKQVKGINNNVFEPNPSDIVCKLCEFQKNCKWFGTNSSPIPKGTISIDLDEERAGEVVEL